MRAVTAFLSFRREDVAACALFRRRHEPIAGLSFAVQPFAHDAADWKTPCRALIERSAGVVVLIGATTAESAAVRWEIDVAGRSGKPVLGVRIPGRKPSVPAGLAPVLEWADGRIAEELAAWSQGCQPTATTAAMIAANP